MRLAASLVPMVTPALAIGVLALGACREPTRVEEGLASFYTVPFHGRRAASGEHFDHDTYTAAHPTLPFGTRVKVTNLDNGRSVWVRINDRGPYAKRRIIDLSLAAAKELRMTESGTARVRLEAYE